MIARKPNRGPRRQTLIEHIDTAVTQLDAMVGRWFDGLPTEARAEAAVIRAPLEADLIACGVRGQQEGR